MSRPHFQLYAVVSPAGHPQPVDGVGASVGFVGQGVGFVGQGVGLVGQGVGFVGQGVGLVGLSDGSTLSLGTGVGGEEG